jgi:SAM-dependent methyltransferase
MSTAPTGRARADELGSTYDGEFYDDLDGQVRASAGVIAPMIVDLLHPSSMLDVGCGRGTWLHAFADLGVQDIVGVDGPHVAASDLEIPAASFLARDLREPLDLARTFDLVISLEVAEHLAPDLASTFVQSLTRHADSVLFSAAIPFQGGAGHVNEQWQSHWAAEFAQQGFVPVDAIRPLVWSDPRVAFWYAQNVLLYVRETSAPELTSAPEMTPRRLDLVHPDQYLRLRTERKPMPPPSLRRLLRDLPGACRRTVVRRLGSGGAGRNE